MKEQLYTLGLLFSDREDPLQRVALIKKAKGPPELIGLWNGLGGKVERGEGSPEAMRREFREESGVDIQEADWDFFLSLEIVDKQGCLHSIDCYRSFSTEKLLSVRTVEEETVYIADINHHIKEGILKTSPTLDYLIPLALCKNSVSGCVDIE